MIHINMVSQALRIFKWIPMISVAHNLPPYRVVTEVDLVLKRLGPCQSAIFHVRILHLKGD